MIYNDRGNAVGFKDTYDFDSKSLGIRPVLLEIQTRAVNYAGKLFGNAKSFDICYGVGC